VSETLKDARIAKGMQAQMALRKQRLDEGARQIGWKVGLGAPAAQVKHRLHRPLVGFLLDSAELASGATVSLSGWTKPAAEAEIAAYIGKDLPAGASRDQARNAIVAIGPAIELVDVDAEEVADALAGDIYQRHVIFGPRDIMRAGARLNGLTAKVTRSGQDNSQDVPAPRDLETNIGDIVDIVRHVADVAAAVDDGLRAGQVIITGSLTAPMFLQSGETGVDFALDPIGQISVRFS
jgi:2-keto-4-pentenoate hydratase